jgi:cytochrome c biogenesis protein CcdA
MPSEFHNKQKSLKRRFLFILGAVAFVCYVAFGFLIIFWDEILPDYGYKKTLFGCLLIIYGIYRFARLFKQEEGDEE